MAACCASVTPTTARRWPWSRWPWSRWPRSPSPFLASMTRRWRPTRLRPPTGPRSPAATRQRAQPAPAAPVPLQDAPTMRADVGALLADDLVPRQFFEGQRGAPGPAAAAAGAHPTSVIALTAARCGSGGRRTTTSCSMTSSSPAITRSCARLPVATRSWTWAVTTARSAMAKGSRPARSPSWTWWASGTRRSASGAASCASSWTRARSTSSPTTWSSSCAAARPAARCCWTGSRSRSPKSACSG